MTTKFTPKLLAFAFLALAIIQNVALVVEAMKYGLFDDNVANPTPNQHKSSSSSSSSIPINTKNTLFIKSDDIVKRNVELLDDDSVIIEEHECRVILRATNPFTLKPHQGNAVLQYFEMEVKRRNEGENNGIEFGLSLGGNDMDSAHFLSAYTYRGKLFNGWQHIDNFGPSFAKGDTFGCGIFVRNQQAHVFYTKYNPEKGHAELIGNLIKTVFIPSTFGELYPKIVLYGVGVRVKAKFFDANETRQKELEFKAQIEKMLAMNKMQKQFL